MEQIRVLCYGDSNTWGYISGSDHERYGNKERWTKILAELLGDKFEIIEEGLNSRTLISNINRQRDGAFVLRKIIHKIIDITRSSRQRSYSML